MNKNEIIKEMNEMKNQFQIFDKKEEIKIKEKVEEEEETFCETMRTINNNESMTIEFSYTNEMSLENMNQFSFFENKNFINNNNNNNNNIEKIKNEEKDSIIIKNNEEIKNEKLEEKEEEEEEEIEKQTKKNQEKHENYKNQLKLMKEVIFYPFFLFKLI
jgi:hypothetical protein